jgi:hypothetical protein
MASKGQMTGMRGVYLVAAELSKLGFIVSPTSRSAAGADLLVTDQECRKAWSVQVKTNGKPVNFWLVGEKALRLKSDSLAYVFVNLRNDERPEYIVASSAHVASKTVEFKAKTGALFWSFYRKDRPVEGEGWELFGDPHPAPEVAAQEETTADQISN